MIEQGTVGETYCVGGDNQPPNIEVVQLICKILDEVLPQSAHKPHNHLLQYVKDRPGHDRRYDIKIEKIGTALGWEPGFSLEEGLRHTIAWYLENDTWVQAIHGQADYQGWLDKNYKERK